MAGSVRLVLHPLFPPGVDAALSELSGVEVVRAADDAHIERALAEAPVLVTFLWSDRFLTPALRWVQSISAGVDQFPIETFEAEGVVLTSARGVHGPQVAEHAFALLLALTRGIGRAMRDATDHSWRQRMGHELGGRVLGILGLGSIGEEIARRAVAWGMTVIGTKADPARYDGVAGEVYGPTDTIEVFRRADVVVSVLPDSPATRGIVDRRAFEALGRGWFVNVGRGSAVDQEALLDALNDGELRGAGLDVVDPEPLPVESPLWDHPDVVLTPHVAGLSPEYGPRLARIVRANLEAFAGEAGWLNRVV